MLPAGLADRVAGWLVLVLRAFGSPGAGPGGFRRVRGGACCIACAAECGADPAGGHLPGRDGGLPGQAPGGQGAGEPQLVPGRDDDPGPAVGGGGVAEPGGGPAELLLEEAEAVLDV